MARAPRDELPGSFYHVMNRGIAKRPIFEDRSDRRHFLSRLARCVRLNWLEVHAFTLLSTHFHLVVRSTNGRMSDAMRSAQHAYVRRFNRKHARDGPLFRGRFLSRRIDSELYWWRVLRYIDLNPVLAGLVSDSRDYPYGSAHFYASATGAPWLSRQCVEDTIREASRTRAADPIEYAPWLSETFRAEDARWVEQQFSRPDGAAMHRRIEFTAASAAGTGAERRSELADGVGVRGPSLSPEDVERAVELARVSTPEWRPEGMGARWDPWLVVAAGQLHGECGLAIEAIAVRLRRSRGSVARAVGEHRRLVEVDGEYRYQVNSHLRAAAARS
jgi:REP element-mobilizing transposase RayT